MLWILAWSLAGFGGVWLLSLIAGVLGWLGALALLLWAFAGIGLVYHLGYVRLTRPPLLRSFLDSLIEGAKHEINLTGPIARLAALRGGRDLRARLNTIQEIIERAPDRRRAFDPLMSATILLFHGPSGTGKHTAAEAFASILAGSGVFAQMQPVRLHANDVIYAAPATVMRTAAQTVMKARDGVVYLPHADWLVPGTDEDRGRAIAFGRGLLKAVEDGAPRPFLMIVGSDRLARQFLEDAEIRSVWLNKCHVEQIAVQELTADVLARVFRECARARQVTLAKDFEEQLVPLIKDLQKKAGDRFDNAVAMRRWFEKLVSEVQLRRPDLSPEITLKDAHDLKSSWWTP